MKLNIVKKIFSFLSLSLFFILTSTFLSSCSTTYSAADAFQNETPEQIFVYGEKELRDRNYGEAIKRFEALDVQYPFGHNTEIAQLHLIYAYYMQSDYLAAESAADRFIHTHPASPHVDYAYYMRGLSNYYQNLGVFERLFNIDLATRDLSQIKKADEDFSIIVRLYPDSCYAPAAHQQLIYLRNLIALHDYQVACYYFGRCAYVAAANRASLVVRHYQGAPIVPDALVIMIKSYRALGLCKDADETMRVLVCNYPNSVYVQQASS